VTSTTTLTCASRVLTGAEGRFWTVENTDGVHDMLANTGDYANIVNLIREGMANAHGIVNCEKPIVSAINGEAMGSSPAVGLLADISVASTPARLIDGHLLQGIAAGDHSVMIWPLLCGLANVHSYRAARAARRESRARDGRGATLVGSRTGGRRPVGHDPGRLLTKSDGLPPTITKVARRRAP
jgi:enoyl-CoA hydratase/carnithine racemase